MSRPSEMIPCFHKYSSLCLYLLTLFYLNLIILSDVFVQLPKLPVTFRWTRVLTLAYEVVGCDMTANLWHKIIGMTCRISEALGTFVLSNYLTPGFGATQTIKAKFSFPDIGDTVLRWEIWYLLNTYRIFGNIYRLKNRDLNFSKHLR